MKKLAINFGVLCLAVSCTVNAPDKRTPSETFYAEIEPVEAPATKVYADAQLRVLWDADDRITVFNKYTFNQEYRFSGRSGANSGEFGVVDNGSIHTGNDLENVYAIYPYQSSTEISNDGLIGFDLSSTQVYREDSFGKGANVMVSATGDNNLRFKNLCGYISFQFYGTDLSVSSIRLKGNNSESLSGHVTVTATVDALPELSFNGSECGKEIELYCENPVQLASTADDATVFWMVIPPTVFENGFTLMVQTNRGVYKRKLHKEVEISRNKRTKMSAIEVIPAVGGLQNFEEVDDWNWDE